MIDKEKINHIAALAKLSTKEINYDKIGKQLNDILTEIDKINEVELTEEMIMISPSDNKNEYEEDVIGTHINKNDAFKNAKHVKGDYLVVPKVIE